MVSAKLTRRFKKWKLYFSPQKKNNDRIFSFAWNIVYWLLKRHCFEFFGGGKYGLFWAKKLMQILYSLLKSSCFELFGNGRYGLFLRQKVNEKMIFTNYWMFLFWTFWGRKIRSFLRKKVDGKMIFAGYWKGSCFELFRDRKCGFFWDKKMIFTGYWKVFVLGFQKVLVLSFSVMGNTVVFLAKKLM